MFMQMEYADIQQNVYVLNKWSEKIKISITGEHQTHSLMFVLYSLRVFYLLVKMEVVYWGGGILVG